MTGWPSVTSPNCRAKSACCPGVELLVAEEDDVVGVEGLAYLGHHRRAERPGQVDAVDLGPDDRGQGTDVEFGRHGHRSSVPQAGALLNRCGNVGPGRAARRAFAPELPPVSPAESRHGRAERKPAHEPATDPTTQLLPLVPGGQPADGHRGARRTARRPRGLRPVARTGSRRASTRPWLRGRSRFPRTSRSPRTRPVTDSAGSASCSTPRPPCRSRPTCWYPTAAGTRARPSWPCTGTDPASHGSADWTPRLAPGSDYAAELARRGHVVLAPDMRCFGERADWNPDDHYACDTNLVHQVMGGWNPLTQNLWDLGRALDVLQAHPLVDPDRMGVAGFSYGGTMALFLAATDARVAAAVVSGYFSSWAEAHKVPWNMCGSQVLFGMLGTDGARGPGRPHRPPAAPGGERARRPALPRWPRPRPRWPVCARSTTETAPAIASSTTPSTATTSGTGRWPIRSSIAGWGRPSARSSRPCPGRCRGRPVIGSGARPSPVRGRRWHGRSVAGSRPGTPCRRDPRGPASPARPCGTRAPRPGPAPPAAGPGWSP